MLESSITVLDAEGVQSLWNELQSPQHQKGRDKPIPRKAYRCKQWVKLSRFIHGIINLHILVCFFYKMGIIGITSLLRHLR